MARAQFSLSQIRKLRRIVRKGMGKGRAKFKADLDKLELEFWDAWKRWGGREITRHVQFHPTRRWELDFAHEKAKVGIEIHGGIFVGGRHNKGTGFWADRIKMNAAQRLGWAVFEIAANDLTDHRVFAEIQAEIDARLSGAPIDRSGLRPFADVFAETKSKRQKRAIKRLLKKEDQDGKGGA